MTIRLSPTKVLTGVEGIALTTHRTSVGTDHANLAAKPRVVVAGCEVETLNNEQSTAIGGSAANEFVPIALIFHMEAVGVGAAANGDVVVTVGITTGGTEILGVTTLTNLIALNTRFVVALTGLTATIPADSTIYCKVTTADTTAGAGHLLDCYLIGETFVSGT